MTFLVDLEAANLSAETTQWIRASYEQAVVDAVAQAPPAPPAPSLQWEYLGQSVIAETGSPSVGNFTLDWDGIMAGYRNFKAVSRLYCNSAQAGAELALVNSSDVVRSGTDGTIRLIVTANTVAGNIDSEGNLTTASFDALISCPQHNGTIMVNEPFVEEVYFARPNASQLWGLVTNARGIGSHRRVIMRLSVGYQLTTDIAKLRVTLSEATFRGSDQAAPAHFDVYGQRVS